MNTFRILIQEYLGYEDKKPHYGKARQITVKTMLTLDEFRDAFAMDYKIPIRKVGKPKE